MFWRKKSLFVCCFSAAFVPIIWSSPAPAPLLQLPTSGAINVDPDPTLTWRWIDDLVSNGSFETGFNPGWYTGGDYPNIWQIYTSTTNAYGMGFKWATTQMPMVALSSGQLFQDLDVPSDAISATLQWKERIFKNYPGLVGRLRVMIFQGGVPVALLEDAMGSEAQFLGGNWVSRSTNLLAYAGQSIQLVIQANGYVPAASNFWFADLEGFTFKCEYFSAPPDFQVYIGKNATLPSTNLVTTTTELRFSALPLDSLTTYFWRVGAVRDGVTNYSNTAQFKTRQRVLPQLIVTGLTSTGILLSFPSRTNRYYTVEQRVDLDTSSIWSDILSAGLGTGEAMEVELPYPLSDTAFWRLRESP
jgi:hypothetical protein